MTKISVRGFNEIKDILLHSELVSSQYSLFQSFGEDRVWLPHSDNDIYLGFEGVESAVEIALLKHLNGVHGTLLLQLVDVAVVDVFGVEDGYCLLDDLETLFFSKLQVVILASKVEIQNSPCFAIQV